MSMPNATLLKNTLLDIGAVFWPTACVICDAADRDLCETCRNRVLLRNDEIIQVSVRQANSTSGSSIVKDSSTAGHSKTAKWLSAGEYEGDLKKMLLALKNNAQTGLAKPLGHVLAPVFKEFLSDPKIKPPVWVVLIPSLKSRQRERGFSHLELMTKNAFKKLGVSVPVQNNLLLPKLGRKRQVGLSHEERRKNAAKIKIKRKFKNNLTGKKIILVDDVITTGASLHAATQLLLSYGAEIVGAVTLCITKKRAT